MNLIKPFIFVASVYLLLGCSTASKEEELLTAIEQFNDAFSSGDVNTLESMITENYLHSNGSSKAIRKENWLNYLRKREADIRQGKLEVLDYQFDEVAIEKYNDAAFVTGRVTSTTRRGSETVTSQYRITHLWIYESGNWKRAGFHDGKIK